MLAMLRPITPFIEYAIDQDYIAEFLCINQDKPELQCNGKCYLYKGVEKQQSETPKSLQISLKEYPIGFVYILNYQTGKELKSLLKKKFSYISNYSFLFEGFVFHPAIITV